MMVAEADSGMAAFWLVELLPNQSYSNIKIKLRWQGCDDGGCSSDLAIQLIFVMIGSQFVEESFLNSDWLLGEPIKYTTRLWKLWKLIGKGVLNFFGSRFFDRRKDKLIFDDNNQKTQWEKDFKLLAPENWTNGELKIWRIFQKCELRPEFFGVRRGPSDITALIDHGHWSWKWDKLRDIC